MNIMGLALGITMLILKWEDMRAYFSQLRDLERQALEHPHG